ncbi:unnamed protein product [Ixodes pacificus]
MLQCCSLKATRKFTVTAYRFLVSWRWVLRGVVRRSGDKARTGKPKVQPEAGGSETALARRRRLGWRVEIDGAAVLLTCAPQRVHLLSTGVKASREPGVRPGGSLEEPGSGRPAVPFHTLVCPLEHTPFFCSPPSFSFSFLLWGAFHAPRR